MPLRVPNTSPSQPPTRVPSFYPTIHSSSSPSQPPSNAPTNSPSRQPSASPSQQPTNNPTTSPTLAPTANPTPPTESRTAEPIHGLLVVEETTNDDKNIDFEISLNWQVIDNGDNIIDGFLTAVSKIIPVYLFIHQMTQVWYFEIVQLLDIMVS